MIIQSPFYHFKLVNTRLTQPLHGKQKRLEPGRLAGVRPPDTRSTVTDSYTYTVLNTTQEQQKLTIQANCISEESADLIKSNDTISLKPKSETTVELRCETATSQPVQLDFELPADVTLRQNLRVSNGWKLIFANSTESAIDLKTALTCLDLK